MELLNKKTYRKFPYTFYDLDEANNQRLVKDQTQGKLFKILFKDQ